MRRGEIGGFSKNTHLGNIRPGVRIFISNVLPLYSFFSPQTFTEHLLHGKYYNTHHGDRSCLLQGVFLSDAK